MTAERRGRVLEAMAERDVDALILGKEANARYVSGARRLWLAGARAFAPGCVLVGETGEVHLLSITDDGVPPEVPVANLYPITWNPVNLFGRLAAIEGLASARRIGVDDLTPLMEMLLTSTFPKTELTDGRQLMLTARAHKLPAEVERIRAATVLAARALDDVVDAVRPGARECDLKALFEQRMCELRTTTPAFEGTFGHRFPSARALEAGELVVLDVGVLVDGYEGGLARTVVCGQGRSASMANPADGLFDALLAGARPDATAGDLWAAWDATGHARPTEPVVVGVGLGVEPPIFGDEGALAAGTTISLRAEAGGWVRRETVLVTESGAEVLG